MEFVLDDKRGSYARCFKSPFDDCQLDEWYSQTRVNIPWRPVGNPFGEEQRKTAWYVWRGCSCPYKYGGTSWTPFEFPNWLQDITLKVIREVERGDTALAIPNSCNAKLHSGGNAAVAWHSDNEKLFRTRKGDNLIISLSLGALRRFQIRAIRSGKDSSRTMVAQRRSTYDGRSVPKCL